MMSGVEESLKSLSLDYLNLLINGQAFSDVTFNVEGRLVHAHRCILAARSLFFRKFFCSPEQQQQPPPPPAASSGAALSFFDVGGGGRGSGSAASSPRSPPSNAGQYTPGAVIPVNSVSYEVFLLMLQFLYSGQVSIQPQKHEPRPNCGERGCWHTHCTSAVDLALDTLAAARSFGVEQLALLTQKQLASMVEKASIEDVMKVLLASRKQDMHQLWSTCSHLVSKSGLPPEVLAKHLPLDIVAKIEEIRLKSSLARRSSAFHHPLAQHGAAHHHPHGGHHHHLPLDMGMVPGGAADHMQQQQQQQQAEEHHQKIRRMRRALDSSDVELVKLMVMGEGLNLDDALALHYAVENCSREVVKALLELGAADVNCPAGPAGKTPLHLAAEMVCPDMVAVLLDHHADPNVRTVDGVTPLDVLRTLTSEFLFKGAVPGLSHIEPNKLRLCLELVQSAALVISREEAAAAAAASAHANNPGNAGGAGGLNMLNPSSSSSSIYPTPMNVLVPDQPSSSTTSSGNNHHHHNSSSNNMSLSLDSRMVYLNLGMAAQMGCKIGDDGHDDPHDRSNASRSGGGSGGNMGPSSLYSHHHDFP